MTEPRPGTVERTKHQDGTVTLQFGRAVRWGWQRIGMGGAVDLWGHLDLEIAQIKAFLHADAADALNPGERYELREQLPQQYGQARGMAWFRDPGMDAEHEWEVGDLPKPVYQDEKGIILHGRYVAPPDAKGRGEPLDPSSMMPAIP